MPSPNTPTIRPLGSMAQAILAVFRQPKPTISNIDQVQQFGPLQPVRPIGGPGASPWVAGIQPGQNMIVTPRSREPVSAHDLREASMYDLARVIIENVEDQVSVMPINVRLKRRLGEDGKEYAKRKPDPAILRDIEQFLERPNADQSRAQFMRQLLDDMLVIDAASVLFRRSAKGGLFDIRAIDGSNIVRYFDAFGATPMAPDPAYAQVWSAGQSGGYGVPWVDLTTEQLLYAMRNCKTYRLYGMSPLEEALQWVRLGALRLQFQTDYYTTGSIPDAIQVVPANVLPAKFKESQQLLNSELSGILSKRRQIRLVQGFAEDPAKDQFIFPKVELIKDEFDEYVIRCLCFAFGTSPQRLARQMNRASAEAAQEASEQEGLEPWLNWGEQTVWTPIIQRYMGFADYEATYAESTDVDPKTQAEIDKLDAGTGIRTLNKIREDRGLPPYEDLPEADIPMVLTGSGYVPVSLDAQVEHAKKMFEATPKPEPGGFGGGEEEGEAKKVRKDHRARIDPARITIESKQAEGRLEAALYRVFQLQGEHAADEFMRQVGAMKVQKAEGDDKRAKEIADRVFDSIEADFKNIPAEARQALQQAALSGVNEAFLQVRVTDGNVISAVNQGASEYAQRRAAELVGMKYNMAGELTVNPNPKFAITETTRERLRSIIANAFKEKTPMADIATAIREADVFSESRANTISRTEVSNAQVQGNFSAWKKSGLVNKVKWLAVGPEPCPICDQNDGAVRSIGQKFPSGDLMPLAHPNCYCILAAVLD